MKAILIPVFAQVLLTFWLGAAVGRSRVAALASGATKLKDVALGQDAWPDRTRQICRAYENQFEMPVLFYGLVALALATDKVDMALIIGAWLFVATRYAHAYIHVTTNHVPTRFRAFAAGIIVLGLMWIEFALRSLAS